MSVSMAVKKNFNKFYEGSYSYKQKVYTFFLFIWITLNNNIWIFDIVNNMDTENDFENIFFADFH